MERIREIREAGTTILFVSHSIYHVRQMCDEAMWLHEGVAVMHGNPTTVTDEYINFQYALSGGKSAIAEKYGGHGALKDLPHLTDVRLTRPGESEPATSFAYGEEMEIHMSWKDPALTGGHHVGFIIYRNDDVMIFGSGTQKGLPALRGREGEVVARVPVSLLAGEYYLSGFMVEENCDHVVDQRLSWARFKVTYDGIEKGIYQPDVAWRVVAGVRA
jgi:lipopolysaccharide transport system ATP-binding protein